MRTIGLFPSLANVDFPFPRSQHLATPGNVRVLRLVGRTDGSRRYQLANTGLERRCDRSWRVRARDEKNGPLAEISGGFSRQNAKGFARWKIAREAGNPLRRKGQESARKSLCFSG